MNKARLARAAETGGKHFLFLYALLVLPILTEALEATAETLQECDGMGRRYCNEAHIAEECPEPCKLEACIGISPSQVERAGAKRPPWYDPLNWEELAFSGLYEFVYTDDEYMCLSSCWKEPWDATCALWEPFWGSNYCKRLECAHDSYNRYSGCHKDDAGNRKKPWHKPTCAECARVFPTACGFELREYLQPEVLAYLEQKRIAAARDLESRARQHCYLKYFGPLVAAGGGRNDAEGQDAPGHGGSMGSEDTLLDSMEEEGRLVCPKPQCLTKDLGLLQRLALPWYLRSQLGSCGWNGCHGAATIPHPAGWCRESASSCIQCGSTWCPPADAPPSWSPLTMQSFRDAVEELAEKAELRKNAKTGEDDNDGGGGDDEASNVDRSMCDSSATVVAGLLPSDVRDLPWYLDGESFEI